MRFSSDIWFCSYLMLKNYKLSKYEIISKNKIKCYFEITNEEWEEHKLKFHNSELSQYKGMFEKIKDLLF